MVDRSSRPSPHIAINVPNPQVASERAQSHSKRKAPLQEAASTLLPQTQKAAREVRRYARLWRPMRGRTSVFSQNRDPAAIGA